MRALDIRRAVAPRFIVIDMEAYPCAAASTPLVIAVANALLKRVNTWV